MENAIRPGALGKKNWLFIGDVKAGPRGAIFYSLLGSCLRRGLNPRAYLHWLGCDREFMSFLQRSGTRASRRCRPAVILTAVGPLPAGRQQPGTAGTAVFHYMNLRSHPVASQSTHDNAFSLTTGLAGTFLRRSDRPGLLS